MDFGFCEKCILSSFQKVTWVESDQSDWTDRQRVGALSAQLGWLSLTECLLYFSVDLSRTDLSSSATVYWLFQNKNVKLKMSNLTNLEGNGLLEFFKYYLNNVPCTPESNDHKWIKFELAKPAYWNIFALVAEQWTCIMIVCRSMD